MTRTSVSMSPLPRIRTLSATLPFLLVVSLVQAQSAIAQERYDDGTFDVDGQGTLTGWSIYGPFFRPEDALGAGVDPSAPRSGGNPGAFLRSQITSVPVPQGESWVVWGILINDNAVYEPGSLGAIERIDFDFDARLPPGARGNRVVSLAVQQDGFLWAAIALREFVEDLNWTRTSISGLQATDFTAPDLVDWVQEGQPPAPDFSENGSPVSFGLVQGQSCPATSDCSAPSTPIEVDIDNWAVTVNYTGIRVDLWVDQVAEPGQFPELPLEFAVSARVRNAGSIELSDIEVRFLLPKEALADFSIPESECIPDSASLNDAVTADCSIAGPIGPADTDVRIPTGVISVGYANVVPDESEFTYEAEIVAFSGRESEPDDVLSDEVVISICNPLGMNPVVVDDGTSCADVMTGGTSGAGGTGGVGGDGSTGSDGGGCGYYTSATHGSNPWLLALLCLAALAIWRRLSRS